jgi:hypothetical protein
MLEEKSAEKETTPPDGPLARSSHSSHVVLVPPSMIDDFDEFAGAGTSDRREDNVVPFLAVLQKGSPQVNERDPGYVRGAKSGMLLNTATLKLYPAEEEGEGPLALQAYMETCEVEWVPRAAGGGFVARHELDDPIVRTAVEAPNPQDPSGKRKLRMLPNGHQLVTTAYHYLVLVDTLESVVVALTSTGLQTHRKWNTMLRNKRVRNRAGQLVIAPSFATLVRLRTFWQKNDAGDWHSLAVDDVGYVTGAHADAYEEAKRFHKLAREGVLRAAMPQAEPEDIGQTINGQSVADDADDSPL